MARHLRIPVIAEGIEGWQQLERLRELGCARVQGHLIAKPAPPEKCRHFLQGLPVDLTDRSRAMEAPEATAIWAVLKQ
jgi:EAL domain-containing protein (putative c-di-GMP-specific phosphodiesterase class I)